jgi:hypothetical protein
MGKRNSGYAPEAISLVECLYGDIANESCVIFLGAGSTTERGIRGEGFYELIKSKAKFPEKEAPPSFPKLMEFFCNRLDGGHKNRLIREAITYIELFSLPGEKRNTAMMLTALLADIPYLNRLVTTNWDPFLEWSLGVLVPIVHDRDLAFWDDKKRQVLKIHGCITRPYSIVATEDDYSGCLKENPLIFNKLRDLMATKTFVFMGYSMRDSDFQEVWGTITSALGRFGKLAYALNPHATPESIEFWKQRGVQIVKTYDLQFVRCLIEKLEVEDLIPPRKLLGNFERQRKKIISVHLKLQQNSDGGMASAMYQDGLLHALSNVLSSTALGLKRKEDFENELGYGTKMLHQQIKKDDPIEIAYWSGRNEVFRRFCNRDASIIPPYFHPQKLAPTPKFVKGRSW